MTSGPRARLRLARARLGQSVATASYLHRWVLLGVLIGAVAGIGAVAFYSLLRLASWALLHELAGVQVPQPAGEGSGSLVTVIGRHWAVPLVVGLGGLLSGLLVFRFAPEAEGHGTDAAIRAVHENPRGIRFRTVVVKLIASALTIGSGGSAGREGPTAQISAGFGSLLARGLNLSPADGRVAVSVGIGAGIGAIFKAPLGGAVLAAEIVYRDDIEVESLLPALIASTISYAIFCAFEGFAPLFGYGARYQFTDPVHLLWFAVIGVLSGLVGLLYAKGFYGIGDFFERLPFSRALRPAVGGLAVGALALAIPEVLGAGYGWVQQSLDRQSLMHLPLAVVLLLPFARILATGLSVGSGGSGGIFGPGIVIGAFVGAGTWRLLELGAPAVPGTPASFVIVGMMACFGSISRAPLAVMIMAAEMTSSLAALAPAMIAVGLATLVVRRADATIYRSQLRSRADSPAHRLQFGLPLLANVRVAEVLVEPRLVLIAAASVAAARADVERLGVPGAPVVDGTGVFIGTVDIARLESAEGDWTVERVVDVTAPSVQTGAALDVALEALSQSKEGWVTIIDSAQRAVGVFTSADLVRGYRRALRQNTARLSALAGNAEPVELQVAPEAPVVGRAIRDAGLPPGTIVVTVAREGGLLFGDPQTVLCNGDVVSALARPESVPLIRRLLGADESADAEGDAAVAAGDAGG